MLIFEVGNQNQISILRDNLIQTTMKCVRNWRSGG